MEKAKREEIGWKGKNDWHLTFIMQKHRMKKNLLKYLQYHFTFMYLGHFLKPVSWKPDSESPTQPDFIDFFSFSMALSIC